MDTPSLFVESIEEAIAEVARVIVSIPVAVFWIARKRLEAVA